MFFSCCVCAVLASLMQADTARGVTSGADSPFLFEFPQFKTSDKAWHCRLIALPFVGTARL